MLPLSTCQGNSVNLGNVNLIKRCLYDVNSQKANNIALYIFTWGYCDPSLIHLILLQQQPPTLMEMHMLTLETAQKNLEIQMLRPRLKDKITN